MALRACVPHERQLEFEQGRTDDPEKAKTWVRWSLLRAPPLIAATFCVWRASEWLTRTSA